MTLAAKPWVFERRVRWGECDPAGIVYTPRFADFVTEAHLAFFEYLFDAPPYRLFESDRLALPAKAIAVEFKRSLRPNECFLVEVRVGDVRTRTYDLDMTAKSSEGAEVFSAKFTLICLDRTVNKSVPLPAMLRDKLIDFRGGAGLEPGAS